MPHVEVLPNSAASLAPGWTYVVDTGYDPSKVAFNPKNKKRAAAQLHNRGGDSDLSARQQTAIARRIAELERDNDPKQNIPIPSASKGTAAGPKTQNTRRILQYQRQIKHWLDDEEAQIALAQQQVPGPRSQASTAARRESGLRRMSTLVSGSGSGTPNERSTPGPSTSAIPVPSQVSPSKPKPPANEYDDDALLSIESVMPPPVTQEELDALLNAPPLSYAASHAKPPEAGGPPQRHFCDNCGYWGTIKCRKCGARVCGLECRDAHEATRCLKWA